ncbi:hypothetical protein P154DRAFT_477386 [Amniculicola lignicola CBS 123094]|uniref:DUF2293 domain-containing protein n=1 Tax=Amniculicola lignicola CBS 123094 TaxID=1392246 RepID=A0A6A5W7D8_9PLEO|nr:hypothetical protein P154DRAFT_477386 [Amniculicola lignicola CBS 123094]
MAPKREITVSSSTPMPKGYAFLPKGTPYKTLHCRRLTHEAGKLLYVVQQGKTAIGIRVPKFVFFQVQSLAKETLSSRKAAVEKKDEALLRQAEKELHILFPKIPKEEVELVLKRAFQKYSRRVGRSGQTPMPRKVQLAVIAHIRHKHTDYDAMLRRGMDRDDARRAVVKSMQGMLKKWGATEDYSWYFDGKNEDNSEERWDSDEE